MKIELSNDNIIVFLNKYMAKNINYKDSKVMEKELKVIFDKLEKYYNIKIKGYYDVYIYIDNNYGVILELISDDTYYLEYDDTLIDMRITIRNINVLYKIDDFIKLNIPYKLYFYKNNLYLELLSAVDDILEGNILENSEIIYKDIDNIKKYGHILKNEEIMIY